MRDILSSNNNLHACFDSPYVPPTPPIDWAGEVRRLPGAFGGAQGPHSVYSTVSMFSSENEPTIVAPMPKMSPAESIWTPMAAAARWGRRRTDSRERVRHSLVVRCETAPSAHDRGYLQRCGRDTHHTRSYNMSQRTASKEKSQP